VMIDSMPSMELCSSSSSSDTYGSESIMASPPLVPDLHISVEVSMVEAEAVQKEVLVEASAGVVSHKG
jgi:hypothetical protein